MVQGSSACFVMAVLVTPQGSTLYGAPSGLTRSARARERERKRENARQGPSSTLSVKRFVSVTLLIAAVDSVCPRLHLYQYCGLSAPEKKEKRMLSLSPLSVTSDRGYVASQDDGLTRFRHRLIMGTGLFFEYSLRGQSEMFDLARAWSEVGKGA